MHHRESLSSAVISPDRAFCELVREAERSHGLGVHLELGMAFDQLGKRQLDELRLLQPQAIFLDLGDDAAAGIEFARKLIEQHPEAHVVAASSQTSSEILMTAMRAGVSQFLPKPVSPQALGEAIEVLRRKVGARALVRREGRVFSFFSAKGGAGSTTVATNFAIQLHRMTGKKTLLVDLDLELGEIALFLGVDPRYNLVDLANNLHRLDEGLLATFVQPHDSGIDLLAAPWRPREADRISPEHVRRLLGTLRDQYDYIVADTSNSLTPRTITVFESSDEVFVVSQVDVPSMRNIQRFRDLLEELRGGGRAVRVVVNRFHPRTEISLKDVRESLGMDIYWVLSNDYDAALYSMNTGKPLVMNVPSAPATEIEGLVAKVVGIEAPEKEKRGLASRLVTLRKRRTSRKPRTSDKATPAPALVPIFQSSSVGK